MARCSGKLKPEANGVNFGQKMYNVFGELTSLLVNEMKGIMLLRIE